MNPKTLRLLWLTPCIPAAAVEWAALFKGDIGTMFSMAVLGIGCLLFSQLANAGYCLKAPLLEVYK